MPRSIHEGFVELLKRLSPLDSERRRAISHKRSVKSRLIKSFGCTEFTETGSFGNHTGIKHYSDIDYFAICPKTNISSDSSVALRELKEELQYTFSRTSEKIKVTSPSVRIAFGKYASEALEITPGFFHQIINTPLGGKRSYGIPDRDKGWKLSSPRAHKSYVRYYDERLDRCLKPLIRLIKAWKFFANVPISSFYLELRITKLLESKKAVDFSADIYGIVKKLLNLELADIRDPMGVSGLVRACTTLNQKDIALSKLYTGYRRAEKALYSMGRDDIECFDWWKKFFIGKFPGR